MQISCVDPLQIQMLIVYNTLLTIASSHSDKIFVSAWSAEHLSLMCVRALFYSFPVVARLYILWGTKIVINLQRIVQNIYSIALFKVPKMW